MYILRFYALGTVINDATTCRIIVQTRIPLVISKRLPSFAGNQDKPFQQG